MCDGLSESAEFEEDDEGMIHLSVSQGHAFESAVAEGKFTSFDDALRASEHDLGLTTVGKNRYSADALSRLQRGLEECERGDVIPGEVVMAELDAWLRELSERTDD